MKKILPSFIATLAGLEFTVRFFLFHLEICQSSPMFPGLPRLVDAAVSSIGPEMFMLQSWRWQLGEDRLEAQHWLGTGGSWIRMAQRRLRGNSGDVSSHDICFENGNMSSHFYAMPIDSQARHDHSGSGYWTAHAGRLFLRTTAEILDITREARAWWEIVPGSQK